MGLSVVSGQLRTRVGTIEPQVGMLTNRGRITAITKGGSVYVESGRRYNKPDKALTVRHTEARRFGYPNAKGSHRIYVTYIRRAGSLISA